MSDPAAPPPATAPADDSTAISAAPERPWLRQHAFKKGQSGNPGGRPKGIVALISEQTNGGRDLIKVLAEIAQGQHGARARDRADAAEKLLNRLWGKPVETQISVSGGLSADALPELPEGVAEVLVRALVERVTRRPVDALAEGQAPTLARVDVPAQAIPAQSLPNPPEDT